VVQAPPCEQHKQHKSREVGNAVPVHGKRADGQGHGVELGVNQHGLYCAASQACCKLTKKEYQNSTKTTKITFKYVFLIKYMYFALQKTK
jgi:hypothetical protein